MLIRPATEADCDAMWNMFAAVIATGDTLPFGADFKRDTFHTHWFGAHAAYVATSGAEVVGMYKMGENYPGPGSHVASATYLVSPAVQGMGIGRALVVHSIEQARQQGFAAMQFNFVVSTNARAVALYKQLGFAIVGTLPQVFRHQRLGLVDAFVMLRSLHPREA